MLPHFTQFSSGPKSQTHTVVIGLDFGTSSSKVVVNNITANKAFAIPFPNCGHPSNKYLLPTRPYFQPNGNLCFSSGNDGIPLRELKATLMGRSPREFKFDLDNELESSPEILTVAYLGQVIQFARRWYLSNLHKAFRHARICWQLNIGVPCVGKEFNVKKESFKQLATGAWLLSTQNSVITFDTAKKAFESLNNPPVTLTDIDAADINAISEVVAEVIGYAKSDVRNNGLHFLVDVGASTVDISSFVLGDTSGTDRYSILIGDVGWFGAFELHKHRITNVKTKIEKWLDHLSGNEDPVSPIPEDPQEYLPNVEKLSIKKGRDIDSIIFQKCCQLIKKTVIDVRKRRDPNSPKWKSGIPIFICGGGNQISFYIEAIRSVNTDYLSINNLPSLKPTILPIPTNLDLGHLAHDDFHRLAVAYGLSFPEYDIGTIYPPDDIPDVPIPRKSDFSIRFIDKDHV